jgi:hypothetical protein
MFAQGANDALTFSNVALFAYPHDARLRVDPMIVLRYQ